MYAGLSDTEDFSFLNLKQPEVVISTALVIFPHPEKFETWCARWGGGGGGGGGGGKGRGGGGIRPHFFQRLRKKTTTKTKKKKKKKKENQMFSLKVERCTSLHVFRKSSENSDPNDLL